jgi:hypothetical protein
MVHAVSAGIAAVPALNVMAAAACPLFATVVVKVVVPQPVLVGAAVPTRAQLGRVSTILSLTLRVADILKLNATVVCEPATGVANESEVCENAAATVTFLQTQIRVPPTQFPSPQLHPDQDEPHFAVESALVLNRKYQPF